ncbi:substrate-binding domain-containing protein [Ferviditalea candida]|uniref:Helix-turn-helix transcriptional regulator n=1 Tax=Ferviditalea candida TaxID=3108399 RepID=A0ABU5ZM71_9BACL|nr:helix-turn-helix transcriptional regulator [Paenibacillaceae bacterium T2]
MTNDSSYTTDEISKLLKISKLTVYDLIKKGELPAYRVGKQMRVDAADLDAYKMKSKGGTVLPPRAEAEQVYPGVRPIVITGQDISLDSLAKHIEKKTKNYRPLRSYAGSMDSLIAMYRGEADIVSIHLLDGDSGEYNLPYVRKILVGFSYIVINLMSRTAGIYMQKGNPRKIRSWSDLQQPGLRIVNREKGSGARVLFDEQLRLHGIPTAAINGYETEESSHMGVAGKVAIGEADAGVGIEKAAMLVGVDFIPLIRERYDLIILKNRQNSELIEVLKSILQSEAFHRELTSIGGYDLSSTGKVFLET